MSPSAVEAPLQDDVHRARRIQSGCKIETLQNAPYVVSLSYQKMMGKRMAEDNYIFLSYSHHGESIDEYVTIIEAEGYHVVYDSEISFGEEWNLKVRRQLSNSRCKGLILFLTERAAQSNAVLTELEYAEKYSKPCLAVVMQHDAPEEVFAAAKATAKGDAKFLVESIAEFFPQNKLYIHKNEFDFRKNEKLKKTFRSWGFFPDEKQQADFTASTYSSEIQGEKERLKWQADGYTEFDAQAIQKALDKLQGNDLVVLDLGCADGYVTYSRFAEIDRIKKVIGVDYNQNDLDEAKRKYASDKFSFHHVDLNSENFIRDIRQILDEENVEGVDIVFAAFILQHVKDARILLLRLFDILNKGGKVIVRESDDGCKVGFPGDELGGEIIRRTNAIIRSSDRDFGRKLYPYMNELGYDDIELMYQITDTIGKSRREREWLFTMGFSFRLNRVKSILDENPGSEFLAKEYLWLKEALDKLRVIFHSRGYYYSARAFIAIGSE